MDPLLHTIKREGHRLYVPQQATKGKSSVGHGPRGTLCPYRPVSLGSRECSAGHWADRQWWESDGLWLGLSRMALTYYDQGKDPFIYLGDVSCIHACLRRYGPL
jgi:hypothetical protein